VISFHTCLAEELISIWLESCFEKANLDHYTVISLCNRYNCSMRSGS
jgi:hypothetical protein